MQAKNGKIVKMKTPADKNPNGSALTITTLERFLKQQDYLKLLLDQSRTLNLTTTKVPISISKIIRLRLGDTFRFLVFHIERHVHQAQNVVMDKSRIEKG